jgi:hypothetical protein
LYDLFEKIKKGSILLWNVADEKDLPKRKEMNRLLGTDEFSYYKTHGHHSDYIRKLGRLKNYLTTDPSEVKTGWWAQIQTSHFLFTSHEIESNSFFLLKYGHQCFGSYFVDRSDIENLEKLLRRYEQVMQISDEIKNWPKRIEGHKEEIKRDGIEDSVIENFQITRLIEITDSYGKQAIDHAMQELVAWHDAHFWKNKKSQTSIENSQDEASIV